MKKLSVLLIILAVLVMCAPSFGYVLVYKVTGSMKAVEWNSDTMSKAAVKGCLVLDVNDDSGVADDAQMVLYGKNAAGSLVYYVDAFDANSDFDWSNTGHFVGLDVWNFNHPFYYEFTMTGKIKDADVGFGALDKRASASSLKGTFNSWWDAVLTADQELFGSGSASMTLDTKKTKAANLAATPVDEIISSFIDDPGGLRDKGYTAMVF